jgi:HK97 family phage major capsid protein
MATPALVNKRITPAELQAQGLPKQRRQMVAEITRAAKAEGEADDLVTFDLSFSSEDTVVERWWGGERLSHDKGAIRTERMDSGAAPLLLNHDPSMQIGRVLPKTTKIKNGRAYCQVQMSRSALAQEIRQDIEDGIRSSVSVGYMIRALELESQKDDDPTYRVTDWEPIEVSIVSIPADMTVGIGRAADESGPKFPVTLRGVEITATAETREAQQMATPTTPATAAAAVVNEQELRTAAINDERTRVTAIRTMARQHRIDESLIDKWIAEGATVEAARQAVLDKLAERAKAGAIKPVDMQLTEAEDRQYSITRAIRYLLATTRNDKMEDCEAGFEREVSQELSKRFGSEPAHGGLWVPSNVRVDPSRLSNAVAERMKALQEARVLNLGTSTAGGNLLQTDLRAENFIELLRNLMYVRQLGATVLSDLKDNLTFPKQTAAGTLVWSTENPGADISKSDMTFGLSSMSPKSAMSATSYTRQFLTQSSLDVENLIRQDLAAIFAIGFDSAAINGTGSSGQPTGILNASGTNLVALGTNGANLDYNAAIDMITALKNNNVPVLNPKFLTTPGVEGKARKTAKLANSIGQAVWTDDNKVVGNPAFSTNQMPSTLTKGTSSGVCHAAILAEWMHLLIGEWGVFELVVDPYSKKLQALIEIAAFQMIDFLLRYPQAFTVVKDAIIT